MDNELKFEGVMDDKEIITIKLTRDVNVGEKIIGIDYNKNKGKEYTLTENYTAGTTIKF